MSAGKQRLSAEHRRELEGQSVIDTAIVAERGYETITADQSAYLSALGIQVRSRDAYPGLLLPMFRATRDQNGLLLYRLNYRGATRLEWLRRTNAQRAGE